MKTYAQRDGPRTRGEILNAIRHHPGMTKTQLCRVLDLAWGTMSHHLRRMRLEGAIERHQVGRRMRYFQAGTPRETIERSHLVHNPMIPLLLEALVRHPGVRTTELAAYMSADRRLVRRQLDQLIDAGLVAHTDARRPGFFVVERALAHKLVHEARDRRPWLPP